MAEPAKKLNQEPRDPSEIEASRRRANFQRIRGEGKQSNDEERSKGYLEVISSDNNQSKARKIDDNKNNQPLYAVSPSKDNKTTTLHEGIYKPSEVDKKKSRLSRHKKATASIVLTVMLILGGIFGFLGLKSFEIIHMMNVFSIHNFGWSERTESRRTVKLIQHMTDKNKNNTEKPGRRQKSGRLINDGITNYRLDKLENRLKARGYEWVYADADGPNPRRATHLRTPRGEVIDFSDLNNRGEIRALNRSVVNEAIPAYRVMKRVQYYRLIHHRTGWSRKFFVGDRVREGKDHARKKLHQRSTEASGNRYKKTGNDKTDEEIERSRKGDGIRKAGGIGLKASAILLAGCTAQALDESSDEIIDAQKYFPYLSLATEFQTIASQMRVGGTTVTSEEIDEVAELLHTYDDKETDENEEKHFEESAAWQRANQNSVIWGEELESSSWFNNTVNPGKAILSAVADKYSAIPGSSAFCDATENAVVQGFFRLIDLTTPSGFISELADQFGITDQIFEKIIELLAGKGGCNPDKDPRQLTNCIDAGLLLSMVEHTRTNSGAPKLSDDQLQSQRDRFAVSQKEYTDAKGLAWRVFSPKNPHSATVQFALSYPKDYNDTLAFISSVPTNIFNIGMRIIRPQSVYASSRIFQDYGLEYIPGFTDEDVDLIDPEQNEGDVDQKGSALYRLTYFCWEEKNNWKSTKSSNCNEEEYSNSQDIKEYIICNQLPYYEAKKHYFEDGREPNEESDKPCMERFEERKDHIVKIGMYLFDRNIIEALAELSASGTLGGWRTHNLLEEYVEDCVEPNERGTKKIPAKCYDSEDSQFIFQEDPFDVDSREGIIPQEDEDELPEEVTSNDTKELARQILDNPNITYPRDAISPNGSTKAVLEELAKGSRATVTCGNNPGPKTSDVNIKMLQFIAEAGNSMAIGVNALTDKCHSAASNHYIGEAVDFECGSDVAVLDRIATKYGGARNFETCSSNYHWHYDFNLRQDYGD